MIWMLVNWMFVKYCLNQNFNYIIDKLLLHQRNIDSEVSSRFTFFIILIHLMLHNTSFGNLHYMPNI